MADQFRQVIEQHQSTIIFVNSRQLCEKLTFLINADRSKPIAYSHHGSLSKELRLGVEKRLKNGKLKAIVAKATLELGIDIGSLDHVILVQSPPTVSSAIQRIGRAGHGVDSAFSAHLKSDYEMDSVCAETLVRYLKKQQNKTNCPLPHRHHVVVERFPAQNRKEAGYQVVIHTFWGGKVNRPFALALEAAFEKEHGVNPSVFPTNDAVYMLLPPEHQVNDIMTLVRADSVEQLLRQRLEGSGIFGARFRECATRALLLPRKGFKQRMPLWVNRQRSQKLLDTLGRYEDFPILLEAWRNCLQDDFDMKALKKVLTKLVNGEISCTQIQRRTPSPLALSGAWRLVNQFMYADDRQQGRVKTDMSDDLITEVVFNAQLRPSIDSDIVSQWLCYYGSLTADFISDSLGLDKRTTFRVCKDLLETRTIISGLLIQDRKEDVVCNADNFETLLRIARRKQKPEIQPRKLLSLSPILARYQKIMPPGCSFDDLVIYLQNIHVLQNVYVYLIIYSVERSTRVPP